MRFIHVIMDLIPVLRTKAGNMLTRTCQYLENIINKLQSLASTTQYGIAVKTKEYFVCDQAFLIFWQVLVFFFTPRLGIGILENKGII